MSKSLHSIHPPHFGIANRVRTSIMGEEIFNGTAHLVKVMKPQQLDRRNLENLEEFFPSTTAKFTFGGSDIPEKMDFGYTLLSGDYYILKSGQYGKCGRLDHPTNLCNATPNGP